MMWLTLPCAGNVERHEWRRFLFFHGRLHLLGGTGPRILWSGVSCPQKRCMDGWTRVPARGVVAVAVAVVVVVVVESGPLVGVVPLLWFPLLPVVVLLFQLLLSWVMVLGVSFFFV